MRKFRSSAWMKIGVTLFTLALTACGGGGGGGGAPPVPIASAGIYSGTVTPNSAAVPFFVVGLMTTDNRVGFFASGIVNDTVAVIGTRSNNTITGTLFNGAYNPSAAPMSGQITSVSGNNIGGVYTSSIESGSFSLVADQNLYSRGASLAKITGTWVDAVHTSGAGTTTWIIQPNGAFSMASVSGCAATGVFSLIDASKNEYGVNLTVTNCPGVNGAYIGAGALSDFNATDDMFTFMFSNGTAGGAFAPIKQ